MVSSNIAKTLTTYTYDTLGNLTYEKVKNKNVDYQYNELNQLVYRQDSQNQTYTYSYDLRGNRIAETGKKESREYVYDETNSLVEGTSWKGDKSAYTYNGLGVRINNTHTTHSGSVYDRDYVIDYTSLERDDLMVYAEGNGQLEYVQREVYAGSERIEQFTDRSRGGYERLLYVHEDLQGNTRYYTKATGQSFAELTYDAWGMPESPNRLLNNDHGNYVYATYTGHIFDTTLDIYFCEARFYDASTRTWMAMDPVKDGGNWYQYCYGNPLKYWDPLGMSGFSVFGCPGNLSISQEDMDAFIRSYQNQTASYNLGGLTALVNIIGTSFYDTGKLIILALLRTENQRNQFLQYTAGDVLDYEVISALADDKTAYYRGIRDAGTLMMIVSVLEMVGGIATFINGAAGMIGGSALSLVPGGIAFGGAVTVTASGAIAAGGVVLTMNGANTYNNARNSRRSASEKLNELRVEEQAKTPENVIYDSRQVGKKWGKHKTDYPNMNNYNDYRNYANDVFKTPDKIIYDAKNKEYLYVKGNDLLRIGENGNFISLYPGADSAKVTDAIAKGGIIWP